MANWLVFSTEDQATTANGIITTNMACPIVGKNALTGEPQPAAQQTTQWAVPVQRLDGAWVFPSPNETFLSGVANVSVSAYDPTWFPVPTIPGD